MSLLDSYTFQRVSFQFYIFSVSLKNIENTFLDNMQAATNPSSVEFDGSSKRIWGSVTSHIYC